MKIINHLKTVIRHRHYVFIACVSMGIFFRGLKHDLSKFSPTEFKQWKYANGTQSPHEVMRQQYGYSPIFLNHYHKNDHHWEYWLDFDELGQPIPIKMPYNAVIEMFCDLIGAGRAYNKNNWTTKSPLNYYVTKCAGKRIMNKQSERLLKILLINLSQYDSLSSFVKNYYKQYKSVLRSQYKAGEL